MVNNNNKNDDDDCSSNSAELTVPTTRRSRLVSSLTNTLDSCFLRFQKPSSLSLISIVSAAASESERSTRDGSSLPSESEQNNATESYYNSLSDPSSISTTSSSLSSSSYSSPSSSNSSSSSSSTQSGGSMMGRFFERRGISPSDVPGALVFYNGLLWTQWLGIMVISVKYRPMRRLYKSPTVTRFHRRMHRKYSTYARLETYFHKQAERVSQWKWLQTLVTKYLKIYDFRSLPYAVLEGTVLYNVLLFPVLFPSNFLITIRTIAIYRRCRANPNSSNSLLLDSDTTTTTATTTTTSSPPSSSSSPSSSKKQSDSDGGSDRGSGPSGDGFSPPLSSLESESASDSADSNRAKLSSLSVINQVAQSARVYHESSQSQSVAMVQFSSKKKKNHNNHHSTAKVCFSPDFVLDRYCRSICFGHCCSFLNLSCSL